MLIFNDGVKVAHFGPEMATAFAAASLVSLTERFDVYVTSLNDRKHGQASLHYFDLAVDFSVAGNERPKLERIFSRLTRLLPSEFDVILEPDHVHVEHDRRRAKKDATAPAAG